MLPLVLEGLGHLEFQRIQEIQHYPKNDQTKGISFPLEHDLIKTNRPTLRFQIVIISESNESAMDQLVHEPSSLE